ncbi:MAG: hypothetical protein FWH56_00295 [Betaproteobacteria bacterium]|nr:hypothetical protein [Betaproteobacteria bacterium]
MKVRSLFAAMGVTVLSLISMSTPALQCEKPSANLVVSAQPKQTVESGTYSCLLEGESAIHLGGKLTSSLVYGQGFIEVRFVNSQGKQLWAARRGPWVGVFSDFALNESFPVPHDAIRVNVVAKIVTNRNDVIGKWNIIAPTLSPSVLIIGEAEKNTVFSSVKRAYWRFSTVPKDARGEYRVMLRDPSGQTVTERIIKKTEPQTEIDFGKLPVGYYQIHAIFISEQNHVGTWTSAFVVLPDGEPPNESRFGMDGALSWLSTPPNVVERSVTMMRQAGVGTVRDRLKWSHVQPAHQRTNWGRYEKVAKTIAQAGMESVQVFNDAPDWTRPAGFPQKEFLPPLNDTAAFEFGRAYAQGLGKTVRSVEYWNEQNTFLFAGYPFQYASGLKAFSAGIKSVDPNIRVLIGAAAGRPGHFFKEIYRNGVADFFDTRNQHFYGNSLTYGMNIELDSFFDQHVAALEREGGVDKKPGWLTETGYSLHRDKHGDWRDAERKQAEYLVKSYAIGFSTGYERVFFFFWPELVEGDIYTWGIVREDLSPRPAYLALALLTRHLAGASIVASERHGTGRTVYFRREDGSLVAVTWGGGAAINRLGTEVEIRDIFGQQLNIASQEANSLSPLMLSRIDKLPAQARQLTLPKQPLRGPVPLRLEARLRINGKDRIHLSGDKVAISVTDGETVEVSTRVYSTGAKAPGLTIDCIPGPGFTTLSPPRHSFELPNPDGELAVCRFLAKLGTVGESYVTVQARNDNARDVVRIALVPDVISTANASTTRPLMPNGNCPRWTPRQSSNLTLSIQPTGDTTNSCRVSITSRINRQGESWAFPSIAISENEFTEAIGLRVRITVPPEHPLPPTPLMLQLVEKSGGTWVIGLQKHDEGKNKIYSGMFNLAKPAPWARSKNAQPNLGSVKEIMLGWGGHNGNIGQRHGFTVETIDVLQKSP